MKPIYNEPPWDQFVCPERKVFMFIQGKLTTKIFNLDFISSSVLYKILFYAEFGLDILYICSDIVCL